MQNISSQESIYLNNGEIKKHTINTTIQNLLPIRFELVTSSEQNYFWNKLIDKYHYLGYSRIPGKRIKYLIYTKNSQLLAAIGWKSGSRQLYSRDTFIGWTPSCREKNLDHIITNIRFIIFPWVSVYNLASAILGRSIKQAKNDWQKKYNCEVFLAETFIDPTRFTGTSYKAANWKRIGVTQGYSKIRGGYKYHGTVKEVYIYVVKKDIRKALDITTPWKPKKSPMPVEKQLEDLRKMTFQKLDFNPDLIDDKIWTDELYEKITKELQDYYYMFYPAFFRIDQIRNGELYLHGLLSSLERKHMEGIALRFEGPEKVRGLQKFMKDSPWDYKLMHEIYLDEVAKNLSNPEAMFTIDSSENAKKGRESVGVSSQYCGNTGKLDNCQSGVFLGYASNNSYTLLNSQLFIPEKWFTAEYEKRRKECMIPQTIEFRTKLEISLELLQAEAIQNRFEGKWVGADAFFGSSREWCDEVERIGFQYFAAIRENQLFWIKEPKIISIEPSSGPGRPPKEGKKQAEDQPMAVKNIIKQKNIVWNKVILSEGTKGPIAAEVAVTKVIRCEDNLPTDKVWLIVRKDEDGSLHYYISNAKDYTSKKEFHQVLTMRWSIEQCFEDGKKYLGMDHYEHRSWPAWHRHMLFVFLAMYFLLILRTRYKKNSIEYASTNETFDSSCIDNKSFYKRKSYAYG